MFTLESELKLKAQLKYLEEKQKKISKRMHIFNYLSHEFLWSPTPIYYIVTGLLFILIKKRYSLKPYTIIPFMTIPITMDYVKREFYVSSFKEDKTKLSKVRRSVQQIIDQKKKQVTNESALRYISGVNLRKPVD